MDTYQWQVSTDRGSSFTDIFDGADYTGTANSTMTAVRPEVDKNGYLYRVLVSNSGSSSCGPLYSNSDLLSVNLTSVITNRRITGRVNKQ